ncbi:MAG: response regulator [Methanotrichaceae archaeon]
MLVEDNSDDVELTTRLLKRNNLDRKLCLATDALEALRCLEQLAEENSSLPDLILLDIGLPRVNGFGLLEKLKQNSRFSHIPVVMLTGSNMVEHIQKSYDLGAITYLLKPISEDELMTVLGYLF